MKNKSVFSQVILLVILAIICIVLTVGMAFLAGSVDTNLFDFRNLNFGNMIPILIIGGFISCIVIGITVVFVSRSVFFKVKKYLSEDDENNGGIKK